MDKVQRINITVLSSQDYDMVQLLSDLHGSTLSMIAAKALHEWLKDNFVNEVKRHQEVKHLLLGEKCKLSNCLNHSLSSEIRRLTNTLMRLYKDGLLFLQQKFVMNLQKKLKKTSKPTDISGNPEEKRYMNVSKKKCLVVEILM